MRTTLLSLAMLLGVSGYAQIDLSVENQAPLLLEATDPPALGGPKDLSDLCLPQSEGRFWSINQGEIREWTISGNSITGGAVVMQGPADMSSLAYCSASGVTTFYCDADQTGITYYDNGQWVVVPLAQSVYNHGGAGEHLYFVDLANNLYHFSGTTSTLIANPGTGAFRSDVVVRNDGNAIVLHGLMGAGQPATEFRVYAPDGTIVQTYSASFNAQNAWGSFLLNNTVYIAFGAQNAQFGQQLVPFTLSGSTAQMGTPIPFAVSALDLASCMEDAAIGIAEFHVPTTTVVTQDGADVTIRRTDDRALGLVEVLDPRGRSVLSRSFSTSSATIPLGTQAPGIYLIRHAQGVERVVRP